LFHSWNRNWNHFQNICSMPSGKHNSLGKLQERFQTNGQCFA
jgi:hypothetical protein